jgi:undecaprenyl-diphosphatase
VSLFYAAVLGVVQGITEFLPISSSAHLILGRALFGWDSDSLGLAFDVATHLGTLAAVVVYFRNDLLRMARALPLTVVPAVADPAAQMLRLVVIGTIPVVIVGLLFADAIELHLRKPLVTVVTLSLGAVAFLLVERLGERTRTEQDLTWLDSLLFGAAQALALVPGVSRSGSTITVGMLSGVRRADAARFSFLLGVPAVLSAAGKEAIALAKIGLTLDMALMFVVGILTSAIVGYLTIRFLLQYLATHRLDVFAYYRFALALAVWIAFR